MTLIVPLETWVKALVPWIRTSLVPWFKANPMEALAGLFVIGQLAGKLSDLIPTSRKRVVLLEGRIVLLERMVVHLRGLIEDDDPDPDDEPELPELTLEEQLRNLLADPHKVAEFRAAMSGNQIQEPPRRTWHEHLSDDEDKT